MAWTSDDLAALENAIKKGVKRVSYLNGSVEYHSLDEMLKLRDVMSAAVNGVTAAPRTSVIAHLRD
jgi:hypothetical protein